MFRSLLKNYFANIFTNYCFFVDWKVKKIDIYRLFITHIRFIWHIILIDSAFWIEINHFDFRGRSVFACRHALHCAGHKCAWFEGVILKCLQTDWKNAPIIPSRWKLLEETMSISSLLRTNQNVRYAVK